MSAATPSAGGVPTWTSVAAVAAAATNPRAQARVGRGGLSRGKAHVVCCQSAAVATEARRLDDREHLVARRAAGRARCREHRREPLFDAAL